MQGNRAGTLLLNSNKNIIKSSHTDKIKRQDFRFPGTNQSTN